MVLDMRAGAEHTASGEEHVHLVDQARGRAGGYENQKVPETERPIGQPVGPARPRWTGLVGSDQRTPALLAGTGGERPLQLGDAGEGLLQRAGVEPGSGCE